MKTKILFISLLLINIVSFAQISNFDYSKSTIFSIKIDGLDNIEQARYFDKQLLKSDNLVFVSTFSNEFITSIVAKSDFSFEDIKKLVKILGKSCKLIYANPFDNKTFEQLYSAVSFSKEINTELGILKKYYTNEKSKDELNFSKYQEIISLKK